MSVVGSLGSVSFLVKRTRDGAKYLSFHDFNWQESATWEEHPVNGKKPFMEFIGPNAGKISLVIEVNARYRVSPLKIQKKLHGYVTSGKAYKLVIGGKKVGKFKWIVTSVSDNYKTMHVDGRPVSIAFEVELLEYRYKKKSADDKERQTKKKKTATEKKATKESKKGYTMYTVKKGDTLWAISKQYYGSGAKYTKIYSANRSSISNPNQIYPGQVIKIPK